jgi:hypothetical protein
MKQLALFISGLISVTLALTTLSLASRSGLGGEIGYGVISFVATTAAVMLWGNWWSHYSSTVKQPATSAGSGSTPDREGPRPL